MILQDGRARSNNATATDIEALNRIAAGKSPSASSIRLYSLVEKKGLADSSGKRWELTAKGRRALQESLCRQKKN